jgi:hypothetical protein
MDAHDPRRRAVTRAGLVLALVIVASASPAIADSHAEAVVLFDQGIKDMKAGRLDKACSELQSSLDLVKDSGTKGALARCHGLAGRVGSAWLLWRELSDTAPNADLRSDAAAQARKLESRLPKYTIKLARPMADLVVQINGRDVAANVAVEVPIDPGKLAVTAVRRDGDHEVSDPWTHDYTAVEGEIVTIEIPRLALHPVAPAPVDPRPAHDAELASRRHQRHVIAGMLGVVAIGTGGAGGYFGYTAHTKYDDAKRTCGGMIDHCPPDKLVASKQLVKDAKTAANLSTALAGAAGAVAVVAVIVWVTAPSLERKGVAIVPTATADSFGLAVGGAF